MEWNCIENIRRHHPWLSVKYQFVRLVSIMCVCLWTYFLLWVAVQMA